MELLAGRFGNGLGYVVDLLVENSLFGATLYFHLSKAVMDPLHQAVASVLVQRKPRRILDIGTGDGRLPLLLTSQTTNAGIVGIDSNPSMIRSASRKVAKGSPNPVDFLLGSVNGLEFPGYSFDQILTVASFHHIVRRTPIRRALSEVFRVLTSGGEAWIVEFRGESSRQEIAAYAFRCKGWRRHLAHFAIRLHGLRDEDTEHIVSIAKSIGFKTDVINIQHAALCIRMKKL